MTIKITTAAIALIANVLSLLHCAEDRIGPALLRGGQQPRTLRRASDLRLHRL
jgi:hypothetical protein